MTRRKMTGATCVGDLRLAPLDVGFDLRLHGIPVDVSGQWESVGLEQDGEAYLITGTRAEMLAAIRAAGYTICEEVAQ